ncbi:MAG: hypothetical protein RLZZ426_262, partial [Actinomycetota bacterium]
SIVDSLQLPDGFDAYTSALLPNNDYLILGSYLSSEIAKIRTSDLSLVSSLAMSEGSNGPQSGFISNDGGFGYFGTDNSVFKVNLSGDMSHVSSLKLSDSNDGFYAAAKNSTGTVGYFAQTSWNSNVAPTIHKVNLLDNMTEIKQENLQVGETYITSLVVPNDQYAYYTSAIDVSVKVNKINLATLAIDQTISLPADLKYPAYGISSVDNKYFVVSASDDINIDLIKMKYSDLTIESRTALDPKFIWPWGMYTNPASGAIYVAHGRSGDDQSPISPGLGVVATFAPSFSKPSAPRLVKATYAVKKATFTWSAPLSSGGKAITKYQYCFSACTKAASWKNVVARKIVKTGFKKGATGYLQIRAVNPVGTSSAVKYKFKQTK